MRYGEKLPRPENPTRSGYTFAGWYGDMDLLVPWDFDAAISGNMTLYASWAEGEPENPLTAGELEQKFLTLCASSALSKEAAQGFLAAIKAGSVAAALSLLR